jgi:hypothetical protein
LWLNPVRTCALAILFPLLAPFGIPQVSRPATPANKGAAQTNASDHEPWNSPALTDCHLNPVRPVSFLTDNPRYTVELQQVQWRPEDPIDLYVMKPKGVKKSPIILYLYGYPTDTELFQRKEYQELVTRDGFAAVGFVSALTGHRYHDRPMKQWFVSELQESLATSAHDIQMVLSYLESRDDLDMSRVGMFAQGSGASIAILTSGVDSRIKVLEALDPWGDWPVWMATSPFVPEDERAEYVQPEFLSRIAPLEPLLWLPKIQAKRFRLDNELFDTVTPKVAREHIRAASPAGTTIMEYKNLEEFKTAFQDGKNLQWIQRELQSLP